MPNWWKLRRCATQVDTDSKHYFVLAVRNRSRKGSRLAEFSWNLNVIGYHPCFAYAWCGKVGTVLDSGMAVLLTNQRNVTRMRAFRWLVGLHFKQDLCADAAAELTLGRPNPCSKGSNHATYWTGAGAEWNKYGVSRLIPLHAHFCVKVSIFIEFSKNCIFLYANFEAF